MSGSFLSGCSQLPCDSALAPLGVFASPWVANPRKGRLPRRSGKINMKKAAEPKPDGKAKHPLVSHGGVCYNTRQLLTNAVLSQGGESSGGIARYRR